MSDELLHPDKLLFVRNQLTRSDADALGRLLFGAGNIELRSANISILLPLLHQAREKGGKTFWTKSFFPWISIQQSVRPHRDRILDEFVRAGDFEPGSRELLVHLVNIYRSIVADLLDPYMTLLIGCFQLTEGQFTNIIDANVGLAERNKAEFLTSRILKIDPENRLLSGYDPIVRNAITHSGSAGVAYRPGGVLFRSIKRGVPAAVDTAQWSRDGLIDKIVRLYEFVASIDAAVNVFGVDCSDLLFSDEDVKSEFVELLLTPERRAELRAPFEKLVQRIRDDQNLTNEKRYELLTGVLLHNCEHRKMPVCGIGISSERRTVMVEIPEMQGDLGQDEVLRDAVMNCGYYAVLARCVFGAPFDQYVIRANANAGQAGLITVFRGELLGEYIEERAGLFDLLDAADVRLGGQRVILSVDFEAVRKMERESLDRTFPRRRRPGDG